MAEVKTCSVEGCERPHKAKGFCAMHYERVKAHGAPGSVDPQRRSWGEGQVNDQGYLIVSHQGRQKRAHIVMAEKALGKPLPPGAVVHHIDGDRLNNAPSNLLICPDAAYHNLIHQRQRAIDAGHPANWRKCKFCGQYDDPANMYVPKGPQSSASHRACSTKYATKRRTAAATALAALKEEQ